MNFNLYDLILKDFEKKNSDSKNIIATATIAPLTDRRDGSSVFEEGNKFAGVESSGEAQAYLTMVAAPHVPPTLGLATFIDSAMKILGQQPGLPAGINEVENISPQIMVWWRDTQATDDGRMDMPLLGMQDQAKISQFADVISRQTLKALQILNNSVNNKSTIWGCWGHATPDERQQTGLGRGAPTNKHGHLHVTYFDSGRADMEIQSHLPLAEKVNHFKPLSSVFHDLFSNDLAQHMQHSLGKATQVEPIQENITNLNDASSFNYGYEVTFKNAFTIDEVLSKLASFAAKAEKQYKNIRSFYDKYHQSANSKESNEIADDLYKYLIMQGCESDFAENIVSLIKQVHPTHTQLLTWKKELATKASTSEKIAEIEDAIARYTNHSSGLTDETVKTFEDIITTDEGALVSELDKARFVWPVHASFFYTIDNYTLDENILKVQKIKIFPSLGSTESAVEYKTATILRRPS